MVPATPGRSCRSIWPLGGAEDWPSGGGAAGVVCPQHQTATKKKRRVPRVLRIGILLQNAFHHSNTKANSWPVISWSNRVKFRKDPTFTRETGWRVKK